MVAMKINDYSAIHGLCHIAKDQRALEEYLKKSK